MHRTSRAARLGGSLLSVAALVAFAGCGASEDTASGGGAKGDAAGSAAKSAKGMTIGVSNLGLSFPFPASIGRGVRQEAKALGVKITELDGKGDANKQANDVQDLIAAKPDGILLLPVDSGVAQGLVKQAEGAGVPIMAVASQVGDPKTRDLKDVFPGLVALATQDEYAAGAKAGEIAVKALPQGGDVAVVEGQAGFAEVQLRARDFKKTLGASGQPFKVVASQPGDWLPDKSEAACQNMLAAHPGIDLFYAESDDMAVGCAKAIRAANSKAKVVGIGGAKLGVDAVKKGQILGTVCYKPEDLGKLALKAMVDDLTGTKTLHGAFLSYDTPAITKDNVDACTPQW